jgi:hypothetical protein
MGTMPLYFHHTRILSKTSAMREINLRTGTHSAKGTRKILRAGKVHLRDNGTNAGDARVASRSKSRSLIKHVANFACALAIIPQSHASLDSLLATIGAAQQCIASNSLIIKTVNTPLYTHLERNFDGIYDHLEKAKQEIIETNTAAALELQQANATAAQQLQTAYSDVQQALNAIPEVLSPTVIQYGNMITPPAGLDNNALVQRLYIINNTTVLGSMSSFTALKALILRGVTLNDSMRTSIQTLAKGNVLEILDIQYWGANIGEGAFQGCLLKHVIGFNDVTKIEGSGFSNCTALLSASFPAAESIGSSAFQSCTSLKYASFPAAESIGGSAFNSCTSLKSAFLPVATTLNSKAFFKCSSLQSASFPAVVTIGSYVFYECGSLKTAFLPAATTIGTEAFAYSRALAIISLHSAISIGNYAFNTCRGLQIVSYPSNAAFVSNAFKDTPSTLKKVLIA